MAADKYFYATGRRKTSKARVFLKPGSGKITVNGKEANDFFPTLSSRAVILQPFSVTDTNKNFDARITVAGGGVTGQSEAVRHGIARALVAADAELRGSLKKAGLLKRDSRMVERKKYGRHKARRSTQFSKR
ncbi:30S ribosomal protein S9 [bacterium]|nr:30S ribosomal protein S9 [bacterium]